MANKRVILLTQLNGLSSKSEGKIFNQTPPSRILIYQHPIPFKKDGSWCGGAMIHCWLIFDIGYVGETVVNFVEHNKKTT